MSSKWRAICTIALVLLFAPSLSLAADLTQHLQYGSSGSQVTQLQQFLVDRGFLVGTPTGYFGAITRLAVMNFQKSKGFEQTGEVGPQTRAALNGNSSSSNQALIDALLAQIKVLQAKIAEILAARGATTTGIVSPSPTPTPTPTPSPTPSSAQSDTTPPNITITAPSGTIAAGTTQTTLSVSTDEQAWCAWGTNSGLAFASMSPFTSTGGSIHSTTLTGLANGTSYSRFVKCKDSSGNISADSTISFSVAATVSPTPTPTPTPPPPTPTPSPTPSSPPDTSAPTQPTGLNGSAALPTQVSLSWNASTDNVGVTGYKIFRNSSQIATTPSTSYADSSALASTTYTYFVRAYDAAGNTSSSSNSLVVTTPSVAQVVLVNGAVNIKSDFGAACNGTADDSSAFLAFQQWALNWQNAHPGLIELDVPSGATCVLGPNGNTDFLTGRWTVGIKKFLMKGYGATLKGGSFLGGLGEVQDNLHSARLASVNAGATSVTLLDASKAALFAPGSWVLISGFDLQGLWNSPYGYPSNAHFFEYLQVASVNGSQVTFNSPLKYSYLSTWPNYNGGNQFEVDNGGPGTLYALNPSWDTEVEYDGLTFNFTSGQTYSNGRSATFKDVKLTGGALIPTQNQTWNFINSDMSQSSIEMDKLVSTVNISNSTIHSLDFQSSSIDTVNMDHTSIASFMNGTPKKFFGTNDTFGSLGVGTLYYGHTDEFSCTNCVIGSFGRYGYSIDTSGFSMANGVITFPNSAGSQPWAVPNTWNFWSGSNGTGGTFRVTGVTQDASNTYVQTNLSGTWPTISQYIGQPGRPKIVAFPAQKFTCINCTGDAALPDISQTPPGGNLYSYSKITYNGNFGNQAGPVVWGKLVSMKINVTKPYTGTRSSLLVHVMGQFGNFVINNSDGSSSRVDPVVNFKVAGERTITPAGVTGTQTGDDFTANADPNKPWKSWDIWIDGYGPFMPDLSADDSSTWPSVTIEVVTDQGVGNVPASTMP